MKLISDDIKERKDFGEDVVILAGVVKNDEDEVVGQDVVLKFKNGAYFIPKTKQKFMLAWSEDKYGNVEKYEYYKKVRVYNKREKSKTEKPKFSVVKVEAAAYEEINNLIKMYGADLKKQDIFKFIFENLTEEDIKAAVAKCNGEKRLENIEPKFVWEYVKEIEVKG